MTEDPIPESSIGFSDTWRVRRAAPGTRSSRARHCGPEAIPCHEFQRRPLEHWANLDPKLRTLHVCPSGAPNVARIRWGERIFQKRFLEPAFRPAKPGFIAQQGWQLRWPLETFRCARDRMSYSSFDADTRNMSGPPSSAYPRRRRNLPTGLETVTSAVPSGHSPQTE